MTEDRDPVIPFRVSHAVSIKESEQGIKWVQKLQIVTLGAFVTLSASIIGAVLMSR